jgi:hypothetical protein
MKHAGIEERLRNSQLPTIAAYRSSVGHNYDERQFLVRRVIAQDKARPHFAASPKSTNHTSQGFGLGILGLEGIEHQKVLIRSLVAFRQCLSIGFDLEQPTRDLAPVAVIQPRQLGQDFRHAHVASLRFSRR